MPFPSGSKNIISCRNICERLLKFSQQDLDQVNLYAINPIIKTLVSVIIYLSHRSICATDYLFIYKCPGFCIFPPYTDSTKDSELSELQQQLNADTENEHQSSYLQLLQQREEENRQEVAKLTSEIRSLKLQLIQLKSLFTPTQFLPPNLK